MQLEGVAYAYVIQWSAHRTSRKPLLQRPARPEQPASPLQVAGNWIGLVELPVTAIQQCSDTSRKD